MARDDVLRFEREARLAAVEEVLAFPSLDPEAAERIQRIMGYAKGHGSQLGQADNDALIYLLLAAIAKEAAS